MRFAKITPIVAILALAACDNQPETTAEAPVVEEETAVIEQETAEIGAEIEQGAEAVGTEVAEGAAALEQETAEAVEPIETEVEEEVAVITPEAGGTTAEPTTSTQMTEVEPIVEGGGEPEVTVITPEAGDTETALATPTEGAEATGAISATTAAMVDPGSYASDQLSLELSDAGTFTLTGPGGDEVTGDWRVFGDTMTLSNASGATGEAEFPMTCTVEEEGEGFRISAETGSCEMLDGQVFTPQG
ncbi:hypothetical protein [Salinarimonas sp.]|uniref:hypothetical protein n=1 Tax=Salinarimonas sp. TaxID=2766526 RepID=UPI0032D8D20C